MRNYLALALTLFAFGVATMATTMAQTSLNPVHRTGTVANNAEHGLGPYSGLYNYGGLYNYARPHHRWHHGHH
jgi:hypothetical protein